MDSINATIHRESKKKTIIEIRNLPVVFETFPCDKDFKMDCKIEDFTSRAPKTTQSSIPK